MGRDRFTAEERMETGRETQEPSNPLVAVCGLYCGACGVYLASQEDPVRLERLAAKLGQSVEETRCQGCRSDARSQHCQSCEFTACAASRGHFVCSECKDYPCAPFVQFQTACPHRAEIPADMAQILELGPAQWEARIPERYACPVCKTVNAAYDLACRHCGHEPGSPFVAEHETRIRAFLDQA